MPAKSRKKERKSLNFLQRFVKRTLDFLLSFIALAVLSPVFLITIILVKISSPGPAFYCSDRAGKDKVPFRFYKFRSMHVVDEKHKQKELYTADEDRVFPVGRIIRRLKIDELPQLINIISGRMSIVGPRPMPMSSVDWQYCGKYEDILTVKPGLTSIASLYDYTVGETYEGREEEYRRDVVPVKLELELLYVKKQSLLYDVRLVLRTIKTIFLVMIKAKKLPVQPELKEIEQKRVTEE